VEIFITNLLEEPRGPGVLTHSGAIQSPRRYPGEKFLLNPSKLLENLLGCWERSPLGGRVYLLGRRIFFTKPPTNGGISWGSAKTLKGRSPRL